MPSMFRVLRRLHSRRDLIVATLLLSVTSALVLQSATSSGEPISSGPRPFIAAEPEHPPERAPAAEAPAAHARRAAEERAEQIQQHLTQQRLLTLADQWSDDPDTRDALLAQASDLTPEDLIDALRAPRAYPADAPRGRVAGTYRAGQRVHAFVAHIPDDYTPDRAWPVHIVLHGGGGTPWRSCDRNWEEGEPARRGVILICPSVADAGWWLPQGEESVLGALRHVEERWRVDRERVSIGGASSGGFGTWHAATRFPWLWSAAVVRCAATPRDPETLHNLGELPAFLVHGDRDHQIGVHHSRESFRILQEGGHDVRYVEVPEMGHDFGRQFNDAILDWLEVQTRQVATSFDYRLVRRGHQPGRIHWLRPGWASATPDRDAHLAATLRPAGDAPGALNRVEITTDADLDHLTVLLPHGRWNPARPVLVTYNGVELYRGTPDPSVEAVLDSWLDHRDPGLLTDVELRLDLLPTTPTARALRDSTRSPG